MFRVHFEDEFGLAAYDVETYEDAREEVKELRKLGCVSNIWFENLIEIEIVKQDAKRLCESSDSSCTGHCMSCIYRAFE